MRQWGVRIFMMSRPGRSANSSEGCPAHVPHQLVRDHVAHILQSRGFSKSERLKRFITYTVDRLLAGDTDNLKEYSVALEVFDRSPDYNPKIDAVVRVEARRLRLRLKEYYATEGLHESIRIQFPIGTYVPSIIRAEEPICGEQENHGFGSLWGRWWWLASCLALVATATVVWRVNLHRETPAEIIRLIKDSSAAFDPAVSHDGQSLAYASDQSGNVDIWLRSIEGGEARRLTSDQGIDQSPDFSPDARQIAFRSDRNGGGVYVVPAAGGLERLVAPSGRSPKFSPNGKWIAYWTGEAHHFEAKTFIVPSTGGKSVYVGADLAEARWPVWSPNGRALLVYGSRVPPHASGTARGPTDLFLVPVVGGPAQETGWTAALRRANIRSEGPVSWNGDVLQFSGTTIPSAEFSGFSQPVANLWQVRLPVRSGRVEGQPRRITFGAASEHDSALLPNGGTIYTSEHYTLTPVEIALDESGLPSAPSRPSFSSPGSYVMPRVSRDGSSVVALSDRSGTIDIWLKDLRTGEERAVTSTSAFELAPLLSSRGDAVYFGIHEGPRYPLYRVSAKGGAPQQVCADCGTPSDISPKDDYLLYHAGEPWSVYGLDLSTGNTTLIAGNKRRIYSSRFSTDGKWITFHTDTGSDASPRRIFVAPFVANQVIPESKWIPITDGEQSDFEPSWSTDGTTVFFLSDRDGNRCIWAMGVDRRTKHPTGRATPVIHLHRRANQILSSVGASVFGISVGRGRMIFGAAELSSTIYEIKGSK